MHFCLRKEAVEKVKNQATYFLNRLYLAPNPYNKWKPVLDLRSLNEFLKPEKFKMETPEHIRTSLQTGECVMTMNFKDACFHIPINQQSRKYLMSKLYHLVQSPTPMEFTTVVKEVKLLLQNRGIRIHQYIDDCLVRSTSHQPVSSTLRL